LRDPNYALALMQSRAIRVAAVLAVAGAVAASAEGCGGSPTRSHTVVLRNILFQPRQLVVLRGDTVTWIWRDGSIVHNVLSMSFRGSPTQTHGSFTQRFSRTGTFAYYCTIHFGMTGTIVVR
jgi:plastocyanin